MEEMDAMKEQNEEVLPKPIATPVRNDHSLPKTPDQPDVPTPEKSSAGPFDDTVPADLGEVPCFGVCMCIVLHALHMFKLYNVW